MHSPGLTVWRLSQGGERCLGPFCDADGLFLGRTPLLERAGDRFVVRDRRELERVMSAAYGCNVALESRMGGLRAVAKALNAGDLCRATIAAVMLQIPDLPGYAARRQLEAEDRLVKAERAAWAKMAAPFDPEEHPRWPSGQSDGGRFRPVNDGTESQTAATGGHITPPRNSASSSDSSRGFWSNLASVLVVSPGVV